MGGIALEKILFVLTKFGSTARLFKKIDAPMPLTGKHTKTKRKHSEAQHVSRSGLSSIKLMKETDVSVQIYSFL